MPNRLGGGAVEARAKHRLDAMAFAEASRTFSEQAAVYKQRFEGRCAVCHFDRAPWLMVRWLWGVRPPFVNRARGALSFGAMSVQEVQAQKCSVVCL